jgi:RNA polymerase sigma-70 factor (ECF subfamily)
VDDVTALALAARDGDRVALSSFVRRTWTDVARLVTAVAGHDLAEDAAQEAYLRALRALPAYRGDASARVWLLSIARRTAVDAVRSASRRRRLTRLLTARTTTDAGEVGLGDGVLSEQVLGRLDTDRRTAFALTQLLGFDYATAAQVCDCPVGTIRSRVARARDQLIAELGAEPPGPPGNRPPTTPHPGTTRRPRPGATGPASPPPGTGTPPPSPPAHTCGAHPPGPSPAEASPPASGGRHRQVSQMSRT